MASADLISVTVTYPNVKSGTVSSPTTSTVITAALPGIQGPSGAQGAAGVGGGGGLVVTGLTTSGSNSITGRVILTGIGGTILIVSGSNTFIISGATGFYGLDNPSGFALATNLTQSGVNLQSQIDTLTSNLTTTGVNLRANDINLSGTIASSGTTLFNQITGLSGKLVATGDDLLSQINTISTSVTTLTTNLTSTGVDLIGQLRGLSGAFDNKNYVTGIKISGSATLIGVLNLSGQGSITIKNTGDSIISISGRTDFYDLNNSSGFALSSNLIQTGVTLHSEIIGLSGLSSSVKVTGSSIISDANLTGVGLVSVIYNGTQILVSGIGSAGGEANTASNIGVGAGVFSDKNAVDLRFYSLTGGTGMNVFLSGNQISINSTVDTSSFASTSNLTQTGVTLHTEINSLSGVMDTRNYVTGVKISGSASFTGLLNFSGQGGVSIKNTGDNIITISGRTDFYGLNNASGFALSSDLTQTGVTLRANITSLSGVMDGRNYITGISITGGNYLTGVLNLTTANGISIIQNGTTVQFGTTGTSLPFIFGNASINSGSGNSQFIEFTQTFSKAPIVLGNFVNSSGDDIVGFNISGASTSGFYLHLTDVLATNNYSFHYLATTGLGYFDIGGGIANLGGGMSGQYLRKASNSNSDFTWSSVVVGGSAYIAPITPITPSLSVGNVIDIAALTGDTTINAPTGPVDNGQLLQFRFQQGNTGYYLNWNSIYAFGTDIVTGMMPTGSGAKFEVGCRYHSGDNKWRVIGLVRGF